MQTVSGNLLTQLRSGNAAEKTGLPISRLLALNAIALNTPKPKKNFENGN